MPEVDNQRISLNKLAEREGVAVSTAWRWARGGCRGVRLRTISIGARRYVESCAWDEFVAATTAVAQGEQPAPIQSRTNRSREAAIAAAERELNAAGA